jgi:hypothetical protein
MLYDNGEYDGYRGLDSSCDTEEEVEAMVRLFPDILSRSRRNRGGYLYYPLFNGKHTYFMAAITLAVQLDGCIIYSTFGPTGDRI